MPFKKLRFLNIDFKHLNIFFPESISPICILKTSLTFSIELTSFSKKWWGRFENTSPQVFTCLLTVLCSSADGANTENPASLVTFLQNLWLS